MKKWKPLVALLVTGLGPSLATWIYFVWLQGTSGPRAAYAIAKILLFAFPLFWTVRVDGERLALPRLGWTGIFPGIVSGAVIGIAGIVLYQLVYAGLLDPAPLRSQAVRLGFLRHYWLLAVGWSVLNSAFEEYYWRWFVFGQSRKLLPTGIAAIVQGIAFALHHGVLLATYFEPGTALLATLAVAAGGALWAGLYHAYGNIGSPWVSHVLVDLAVFWIGYDLLFRAGG